MSASVLTAAMIFGILAAATQAIGRCWPLTIAVQVVGFATCLGLALWL